MSDGDMRKEERKGESLGKMMSWGWRGGEREEEEEEIHIPPCRSSVELRDAGIYKHPASKSRAGPNDESKMRSFPIISPWKSKRGPTMSRENRRWCINGSMVRRFDVPTVRWFDGFASTVWSIREWWWTGKDKVVDDSGVAVMCCIPEIHIQSLFSP